MFALENIKPSIVCKQDKLFLRTNFTFISHFCNHILQDCLRSAPFVFLFLFFFGLCMSFPCLVYIIHSCYRVLKLILKIESYLPGTVLSKYSNHCLVVESPMK